MKNRMVVYDGLKAVDLWNGDVGWNIISGGDSQTEAPGFYASAVGWMYRCATVYANAVASIPLDLVKEKEVVDTTDDWTNYIKFLPSPDLLIWLIAASQGLTGKSYLYKSANQNGVVKTLRYLQPASINYDATIKQFVRVLGTEQKRYDPAVLPDGTRTTNPESIVYLWLPDPDVEWGPPKKYPGVAACKSAGVMYNMDVALDGFFRRGMMKVTAFSVPPGTQPADKEKFEERVQRVAQGVRNAFRTLFLEAGKVETVDLGGGVDQLGNQPLTQEQREDMAAAWGIPLTKLQSTSASGLGGGGVSDADDRRLLSDTAIPALKNILRPFNQQVLEPLGLRLVEKHERMEVFQDDENQRSQALVNYTTAFSNNPEIAQMTSLILGIDIPEEAQKMLDDILKRKAEARDSVSTPPDNQPNNLVQLQKDNALAAELQKLQKKALKNIGKAIKFESEIIPADMLADILSALPDVKDEAGVKSLFVKHSQPKSADDVIAEVKAALEVMQNDRNRNTD